MKTAPSLGYMPQLDALRAMAVLAVMAHHFLPVYRYIPEDYLTLGLLAVRLFFVLSGFLITGILLRARSERPGLALKSFYFRRVLRIFPIYYLTLLICFALNIASMRQGAFWHLTYLSNYVAPFHPEWMGPAGHFWSLAVEEQFYFVWPFLMIFLPTRHLVKAILLTIGVAILFRVLAVYVFDLPLLAVGIFTFGTFESLGSGALLAMFHHDMRLRPYLQRFTRACLLVGSSLLVILTALYVLKIGSRIITILVCLGISLLFVVLIDKASRGFKGKAKAVLECAPVLYVGRISYGLYVYHNFMLAVVVYFYYFYGVAPNYRLVAVFATILTFLAAVVSWHLVERPLIKLKNVITFDSSQTRVKTVTNPTS